MLARKAELCRRGKYRANSPFGNHLGARISLVLRNAQKILCRVPGPAQRVVPILREEERVSLRREPERPVRAKKAARQPASAHAFSAEDRSLFESLRARRLEIARAQHIPAYAVFNDATLMEFVRHRPATKTGFAEISGVGKSKLERYGTIFLDVIAGSTQSVPAG